MAEKDEDPINEALTITFDNISEDQRILASLAGIRSSSTVPPLLLAIHVHLHAARRLLGVHRPTAGLQGRLLLKWQNGEWNMNCQEMEWWRAAIGAASMVGYLVGK